MKNKVLLSLFLASSLMATNIQFKEANSTFNRINPGFSPNSVISYNSSIANAVKSVVNISSTKQITENDFANDPFNDPFFRRFFDLGPNLNRPYKRKSTSLGSGVIVSSDGYIVTNNHVIAGADTIKVYFDGKSKEYTAKVIGTDPKTDIAVIKIDAKNLPAITFANSSKLLEGDLVFAIGNPFGVGESVTRGIISGLNKDNIGLNQYENFIQTDASINPGNSGGALVDSRGDLVGINSAIISKSGANNGIGFAIPSNMVQTIAKELIKNGKIERGFLGVSISNLTDDQKEIYKVKQGALILNVEDGFPAAKAGLKRGDLIIGANGKTIKSANELKNFIGSLSPNSEVTIKYERGDAIKTVKLKLKKMTGETTDGKGSPISGLKISNLSDSIRYQYKIPQDVKGVLVLSVEPNSKADKYGFQKDDIIIQVAESEINNIKDLQSILQKDKNQKMLVWVLRDGNPIGIVIK